jgi:hypothetical protein
LHWLDRLDFWIPAQTIEVKEIRINGSPATRGLCSIYLFQPKQSKLSLLP